MSASASADAAAACPVTDQDDESWEILGGDDEARPSPSPTTKPKVVAGKVGGCAGPVLGGGELLACFLCEQPGATASFRGLNLHPNCKNAVRCHYRLLDGVDERADEDALAISDPEAWRQNLQDLVTADGESRKRATVRQHLQNRMHFSQSSEDEGGVVMPKGNFIHHMKMTKGYGSESGSESFDRRLDEASTEFWDSDEGEARVKVKEWQRLVTRMGVASTGFGGGSNRRRTGSGGGGGSGPRRHRARSEAGTAAGGGGRRDRGRRTERSRSANCRRSRTSRLQNTPSPRPPPSTPSTAHRTTDAKSSARPNRPSRTTGSPGPAASASGSSNRSRTAATARQRPGPGRFKS